MAKLKTIGLDFKKALRALSAAPSFARDYRRLSTQARRHGAHFPFGRMFPCLDEKDAKAGVARGHYFHQDILVARRIYETNPKKHVDIGSRIDGFVAHVAVFRQIEVFDIRALETTTKNIIFSRHDLMQNDGSIPTPYCDSLSSLHAIEHFGLGRYGDPIDYVGHEKALAVMKNMLEPGGRLFLSAPIGPQRIEFNAHRVFCCAHVVELVGPEFTFDRFSYIDDLGDLHENVQVSKEELDNSFGCSYGCGIFEFIKQS